MRFMKWPCGSLTAFIIFSLMLNNAHAVDKVVTHACYAVSGDVNSVNIQTRILINDDPVFKVYSFDAAVRDTSSLADRTTDAACILDPTGITDTATEPLLYDLTVTTTDSSHACGIDVETDANGITFVIFIFRIYAYSDSINTNSDNSYEVVCRMDDLTGLMLATEEMDVVPRGLVRVQQQSIGAYLSIRSASDLTPMVVSSVGDNVIMSIEFYPNLKLGPDNYGTHFVVGFLGIDPIPSLTQQDELYVIIVPRYGVRTDILITTTHGETTDVILDGTPKKFVIPSDLMGCSDGGVSEIAEKGVEIETYDMEVGVLVCSTENSVADCYMALPDDVTGTDYVTVSMFAADQSSEFSVIAHEDGTTVTIDIPSSLGHTITQNGTTTTAGGDLTITLDRRMTFNLAQTSSTAALSTVSGYHITSDKPVTVISGTRLYSDDHLMEQMPPTTKFGKHYVLIPADIIDDGRATTYIIQPVQAGDTVVTRYLSETTSDTHTITYGEYLSLDVAPNEPCELTSDFPVIVTQVVNGPASSGFEPAMVVIPPVYQWAPEYHFSHLTYGLSVAVVFQATDHASHYYVDGVKVPPQETATVIGPSGFFFGINSLGSGSKTLSLDDTNVVSTFMAIGYMSDGHATSTDIGVAMLGFGRRLSDLDHCVEVGRVNDLVDNDCDGRIDEEIPNEIDDDGDGLIDEDLRGSSQEYADAVAIRPINCKVSADQTFTDAAKTHDITGSDGCAVSRASNIFVASDELTLQSDANTGTGIKPKILHSGSFSVSQYISEPKLYFMCDIDKYCTSSTDSDCVDICSVGKRKRREDVEQRATNVTTDIWVFPYDTGDRKPTIEVTKQEMSLSDCLDNIYIKLSFIALGLLGALSFCTALCFCCLFRRRQKRRRKNKESQKVVYYDGSTKWF